MRKPIIIGNWKMNGTIAFGKSLVEDLKPLICSNDRVDVAVCPPFTALSSLAPLLKQTNIALGAQNVHWEKKGAFTGEISPSMLIELGVHYVIIGHSERRQYFGETDITVNKRLKAALQAGLTPVVCYGETLAVREAEETLSFVEKQVLGALEEIEGQEAEKIIFAYEPIWAIGTGKTATFAQAEEVCNYIRTVIGKKYGQEVAKKVRLLYGGSVKPITISGLMAEENIDGALIGGASLKAADFAAIVNYK